MTSHTDSSPGNHTPETSGGAAPGETASSTSSASTLGEFGEEVVAFPEAYPDLLGSARSSSTSLASSQPASRSGSASRSLRGLTRSSALLAYLPTLLFLAASESLRRLALGIDVGAEGESEVNGGRS